MCKTTQSAMLKVAGAILVPAKIVLGPKFPSRTVFPEKIGPHALKIFVPFIHQQLPARLPVRRCLRSCLLRMRLQTDRSMEGRKNGKMVESS